MELDGRVEAADRQQRFAPDGEVPAVQDGALVEHIPHQDVRRRRQREIVDPCEGPARAIPVVVPERAGDGHGIRVRVEPGFDALEPVRGREAVRVGIHEALSRFVDDRHTRNAAGNGACPIRTGVIHEDDLVGDPPLLPDHLQACADGLLFVARADDDGDRHGIGLPGSGRGRTRRAGAVRTDQKPRASMTAIRRRSLPSVPIPGPTMRTPRRMKWRLTSVVQAVIAT